ncbi:MAG: GH116 family glycosyl hydrolase [Candidatus Aminicenantales bacterium]
MKKIIFALSIFVLGAFTASAGDRDGLVPRFDTASNDLELRRLAQPNTYFDKAGRRFAVLGNESGTFEAWAYPLKLIRNFEFSFLLGSSTQAVLGKDIVRFISVTPAATTLTYAFQSFTMRATFVTAIEDPGAVILLAVDTTEPVTVVCSFLPVLQPMWPAGLGGQYASWDVGLRAYLISEPTRKNHGYIGSPAAQGISYTPAHMLSDSPNQFKIAIENKDEVKGKFIPIVMAGGKGKRDDVRKVYEKLAADPESVYRAAADHYRRLRQDTLRIKTPEGKIDLAFEWAKVAYDNLMVDNPDLGRGLVAGLGTSGTGGRPGFGWFFGGDAYMNSLSLDSYGAFSEVKDALSFTQKWQRDDGKMAHELSQAAGYLDWFKDYPYGYIHGDTTPFYIAACYDYLRASGDAEFVRRSWASIKKAYDWCLSTDADGDGLMDNDRAGLGALEFGSLTGIKTDIFLAAAGIRADSAMEQLARAAGDQISEKRARDHYDLARKALDARFWDAENEQYAYAFNADGKQVRELTPWSAVPLAWGQGDARRGMLTLQKMNASELTTDWGVRMLSNKSAFFEPLNYNYGAVWPFLTGWVATALFKNDYALQGYGLLLAAVRHTFDNGLGYVTELFSGEQNIWPQEGVCHQGFSSSGVVFPLIRGLLGLEGDALKHEVRFEPRFPADWTHVSIENYKIGDEVLSLRYRKSANKIALEIERRKSAPCRLIFAPALGLGTRVRSINLNGRKIAFRLEANPLAQAVRPVVETGLSQSDLIEIETDPAPEFLPPANESETGDINKGLRIIRLTQDGGNLKAVVEGIAGRIYDLRLANARLIRTVTGGALEGSTIHIQIPDGPPGIYVRHELVLNFR